jgi:ketosteroid isomerase-like protein
VSDALAAATAEAAIRRVLGTYGRGVDRLDLDLVRSCYWDDATEDRGRYNGGVEGFVEWLGGMLSGFESTWHQLGEPFIELDGEVAYVETYCLGLHQLPEGAGEPRARWIPCRYLDRFERREGEWRIARRVATYEGAFVAAPDPTFQSEVRSRRSHDDPAYQREHEER